MQEREGLTRVPDDDRGDRGDGGWAGGPGTAPLPEWGGQPEVLTVPQVARLLGISAYRLRAWMHNEPFLWKRLSCNFRGRRLIVARRLRAWLVQG